MQETRGGWSLDYVGCGNPLFSLEFVKYYSPFLCKHRYDNKTDSCCICDLSV